MRKHSYAFVAIVTAFAGITAMLPCQKETQQVVETFDMSLTGIMAEYGASCA